MKLDHIALSITDKQEIQNFYCNILGMSEIRNFILNKKLAKEIFEIDKETLVFLLQKADLILEVFVRPVQIKADFEHICISMENRGPMVMKAIQNDYECIRIKREKSDLIFLKDNYGNKFEIKELNPKLQDHSSKTI